MPHLHALLNSCAVFTLCSAAHAVNENGLIEHASNNASLHADGEQFLLVTRDFTVTPIRLAAISEQSLVHMDAGRGWVTLELQQCIALLSMNPVEYEGRGARGMVVLADGQRLPGEAAVAGVAPVADTLAWTHPWLGRIDVPFKMISSVLLTYDAAAPATGNGDVILLVNGDRREGFVTAISDPVTIEVDAVDASAPTQTLSIPLDRVAAITMIAPRQTGAGQRVWFSENTVLDVQSISVDDDGYVRMTGGAFLGSQRSGGPSQRGRGVGAQPHIGVSEVRGVLFDRDALVPLASIAPARIEGPSTRYVIPRPGLLEPDAAIGLSPIEYAGPIVVRYTLPAGCQRFVAEAELPSDMRQWGDCELIVRIDDTEVFRARLAASSPLASINTAVSGSELTIEIAAGAHGPIQDRVRLHRAMLLKGR